MTNIETFGWLVLYLLVYFGVVASVIFYHYGGLIWFSLIPIAIGQCLVNILDEKKIKYKRDRRYP